MIAVFISEVMLFSGVAVLGGEGLVTRSSLLGLLASKLKVGTLPILPIQPSL